MKNYRFLLFLAILIPLAFVNPRSKTQQYIDNYAAIAITEMKIYRIPASIKLGQAILESNSGTSELSVNSNNHFGIKCKSYWTGESYYHKDDDRNKQGHLIKSCFRAYESPRQSYRDHSEFLTYTERYQSLFNTQHDYKDWARGLQKCGYATNKKYADMLIKTIEKYNLQRFDD